MKKKLVVLLCVAGLLPAVAGLAAPKNVILMVSDGWSYGTVTTARYWHGKAPVYQGVGWGRYSVSTYSASNNAGSNPKGYDPSKAWVRDSKGIYKPNMAYLMTNATDSASGITALVTGQKNKDGQLNWSVEGKPTTNFAEIYKAAGRAAGAVSTVHWTHATPAGIGSHNASRDNYVDIATEMLTKSNLDVIIGAGNPGFNDSGKPATTPNYGKLGEENWRKLLDGSYGYKLIQGREEFVALGSAATTPAKVCGTYQAVSTAQQGRTGYDATDLPFSDSLNTNIPTMSEMARAALNVLDNNEKGFFVMMEGGACDWACHANQTSRLIEELTDFDTAVESVVAWVEANSSWNDTLLIVTGDHANGMITGPNGETAVIDKGKGVMPGMKWNSGSHTNELIPLYVRGAGSELFKSAATSKDPVRGAYIDNTDVFKLMKKATGVK